ncbi:RES domain-containing protein [Deltaproteobacteria bacterium PRO3]|nr:RES domain-containing protein [Deltaproteobacteria bacterium PRO3]
MVVRVPPIRKVDWATFRLIPSRDPPIDVFDRVSDPDEFEVLYEIEAMTNDRLRAEQNLLRLVPKEEWVFGNNASYLMAPFLHLNPEGSRFSDGSFGVYYCAKNLQTALEETKYHREVFMKRTREKAMHLEMRLIQARLKGMFYDVRGVSGTPSGIYDPMSYGAGQKLGGSLRAQGGNGLLFKSVRDPFPKRNDCAAVFRPKTLSNPQVGGHFIYVWDGNKIVSVYEKQ